MFMFTRNNHGPSIETAAAGFKERPLKGASHGGPDDVAEASLGKVIAEPTLFDAPDSERCTEPVRVAGTLE